MLRCSLTENGSDLGLYDFALDVDAGKVVGVAGSNWYGAEWPPVDGKLAFAPITGVSSPQVATVSGKWPIYHAISSRQIIRVELGQDPSWEGKGQAVSLAQECGEVLDFSMAPSASATKFHLLGRCLGAGHLSGLMEHATSVTTGGEPTSQTDVVGSLEADEPLVRVSGDVWFTETAFWVAGAKQRTMKFCLGTLGTSVISIVAAE